MKCSKCGNEFEGNFCDNCEEIAKEQETKLEQKVRESFIEEEENLISILGTNTAKTFFSTGVLGNGFAILSDKRMYFKGRCYVRVGKGFFKKMEERVVDLNDITGTGFVHNKSVITTVLYWIFTILGAASILWIPAILFGIYFATRKKWAYIAAHIVNPLSGLLYLIDKAFNYSLFEVSYAGGGIAFDLSWITKADSDAFQKSLQKAKTEYKKIAQNHYQPAYSTSIKAEPNVPEQLKQYKDLLDSGVITQEEFETKKQQLLGL